MGIDEFCDLAICKLDRHSHGADHRQTHNQAYLGNESGSELRKHGGVHSVQMRKTGQVVKKSMECVDLQTRLTVCPV